MSLLRTRVAALATAGAVLIALSGCTTEPEPDPSPKPRPSESAAPIFASDDEALAAAVEAYEAYAAVSSEILAGGGKDPSRIDDVVSPAYAPRLREEFDAFSNAGVSSTGASTIDTVSLVSHEEADGIAHVSVYLCRDVSSVRLFDASGADRTPSEREDRVPSQAFLISSADSAETLLVDGVERWSGENFC